MKEIKDVMLPQEEYADEQVVGKKK